MPIVTASSFADPDDLKAFRECIAKGKSEQDCLKVGDNGVGKWGDDCTTEDAALCALPREDWEEKWGAGDAARGMKVSVTFKGKTVVGELRDTMPRRAKITNGAGIDLNPGFAKCFGIKPPFMLNGVSWEWA